jgi:hypothetical protein
MSRIWSRTFVSLLAVFTSPPGCFREVSSHPSKAVDRNRLALYKGRSLTLRSRRADQGFTFHHSWIVLSSEKSELDPFKQVAIFYQN